MQVGSSGSAVLTLLFFFSSVSCFWDLFLPTLPSCLNTRQIPTDRTDEAVSYGCFLSQGKAITWWVFAVQVAQLRKEMK